MDLDEHYSGEEKKKQLSCKSATGHGGISVEMLRDFGPLLNKIGECPD